MQILMTTDTVGGVWTYALELVRALQAHDVEVLLATMGPPMNAGQREQVLDLPNVEVYEGRYQLEWMDDPWEDVARAGAWLLRIEDRLRPDLVHLNHYVHGALPWHGPRVVVGHGCVLSWWRAVKGQEAPSRYARYRAQVHRGLKAADLVVAPTRTMMDELDRDYGPLPQQVVIPNGREPGPFRAGIKEPLVFSAGRLLDEAGNVATLAAAAPGLNWPVYLAGEQQHPDGSEGHVQNLHDLGELSGEEVAGWLSRASIYALPARYEPFGLSALEAGLSRCALVLGDIPSLREVWGDAATFVPPDDEAALAEAINRLANDGNLRSAMAMRAFQRAQRFTPQRMAAGYMAAYRNLVSALQQR